MNAPATDRSATGPIEMSAGLRPRLRPEIVFGPALTQGAATVHHVKDRRTGGFFQVGPKENFVFTRLDGTRSLADIGHEYAARFGRRLGDAQWRQLLGLLATRRLLVGTEDEAAFEEIATAARAQSRKRTILYARLPLVDPDRFLTAIEPRLRGLYSSRVVVPLLIGVAALMMVVFTRIPALADEVTGLWSSPAIGVLALLVLWGSLALHEVAHGLTCKHFGGQVTELGVMWRMPLIAPYCKADDVVLFHDRRHRVYTAFAGVFMSLVVLLPFGALHLLTQAGSEWHRLASAVLLLGTLAALLNLVPFLQLDGYHMLSHALGMANLRVDSYSYCARLLRRARDTPTTEYGRPARIAYACYGVSSIVFGAVLVGAIVVSWFVQISAVLGPLAATAVLGAEAVVAVMVALFIRRLRAKRAAALPGRNR